MISKLGTLGVALSLCMVSKAHGRAINLEGRQSPNLLLLDFVMKCLGLDGTGFVFTKQGFVKVGIIHTS